MTERNIYFYRISFIFIVVFFVSAVICSGALAAEGDIPAGLEFKENGSLVYVGTGFIRGEDIWVPADAMRRMGVPLRDGPNGKGFMLDIQNPADLFGIPEIAILAGNVLPLYFPSLSEQGISYFNVSGMEMVTDIIMRRKTAK